MALRVTFQNLGLGLKGITWCVLREESLVLCSAWDARPWVGNLPREKSVQEGASVLGHGLPWALARLAFGEQPDRFTE